MLRLSSLLPVLPVLLATSLLDVAPASAAPAVKVEAKVKVNAGVHVHRPAPRPAPRPRRYRRRPGPRMMMPLKIDIGAQGANTTQGYLPGVEVRAGIHWASLSPKPTNFDIGLGVFGAALVGADDDTMPAVNNDVVYGGAYLEVGQTLAHGDFWRTWASGRGEYLSSNAFGKEQTGFGVAGRLSAELFLSGVGIEPNGIFLGTYAIGLYGEVGARDLGDDVSAVQVSGGLTFRTPLVFGN